MLIWCIFMAKKKRLENKKSNLIQIYSEVKEYLRNYAVVHTSNGELVIETDNPINAWSILEEYCGELIVYSMWREEIGFAIRSLCIDKNIFVTIHAKGLTKPYYIHPATALFKDETFITS